MRQAGFFSAVCGLGDSVSLFRGNIGLLHMFVSFLLFLFVTFLLPSYANSSDILITLGFIELLQSHHLHLAGIFGAFKFQQRVVLNHLAFVLVFILGFLSAFWRSRPICLCWVARVVRLSRFFLWLVILILGRGSPTIQFLKTATILWQTLQ